MTDPTIVTVTDQGRIPLTKPFMLALGVNVGDKLMIYERSPGIICLVKPQAPVEIVEA
jgi:bifunctional DNA-binding transcriptional regulator/antitoxin component of YhaV-PrlF toxin-antitoxin module